MYSGDEHMDDSIYSKQELIDMGFKSVGNNVFISKKASFYGAKNISIGSNVRIDDFSILTGGEGGINIGSYVHIAAYVYISGQGGVDIGDFVGISSRSAVYSASDDYSGKVMTNPMVPSKFTHVERKKIIFSKHVLIGTGSTVLPGVEIGEGTAVGAMSLVVSNLEPWGIYLGIPAKLLKPRSKEILDMEKQLELERREQLENRDLR